MNSRIKLNQHLPDWQQGEQSTISPLLRVELMNEWLKNIKQQIIVIIDEYDEPEAQPVGFVDL